jgi:hypothetical protein
MCGDCTSTRITEPLEFCRNPWPGRIRWARVHYCASIIALCETVWLAGEEGWIAKDEWVYWKRWLDELKRSPEFRWTVLWLRSEYDEKFLALLRSNKSDSLVPPTA